jgi:hypothetical protein
MPARHQHDGAHTPGEQPLRRLVDLAQRSGRGEIGHHHGEGLVRTVFPVAQPARGVSLCASTAKWYG